MAGREPVDVPYSRKGYALKDLVPYRPASSFIILPIGPDRIKTSGIKKICV
jgi:hypothetical protein